MLGQWNDFIKKYREKNGGSLKDAMKACAPLYQAQKAKAGKNAPVKAPVKKVQKKLPQFILEEEEEDEPLPAPKVAKKIKSQIGGAKDDLLLPIGIKKKYAIGNVKGPEKKGKGQYFEE